MPRCRRVFCRWGSFRRCPPLRNVPPSASGNAFRAGPVRLVPQGSSCRPEASRHAALRRRSSGRFADSGCQGCAALTPLPHRHHVGTSRDRVYCLRRRGVSTCMPPRRVVCGGWSLRRSSLSLSSCRRLCLSCSCVPRRAASDGVCGSTVVRRCCVPTTCPLVRSSSDPMSLFWTFQC